MWAAEANRLDVIDLILAQRDPVTKKPLVDFNAIAVSCEIC